MYVFVRVVLKILYVAVLIKPVYGHIRVHACECVHTTVPSHKSTLDYPSQTTFMWLILAYLIDVYLYVRVGCTIFSLLSLHTSPGVALTVLKCNSYFSSASLSALKVNTANAMY